MGETSPTDWVSLRLQFAHFALDWGMGETSPTNWVFLTLQFAHFALDCGMRETSPTNWFFKIAVCTLCFGLRDGGNVSHKVVLFLPIAVLSLCVLCLVWRLCLFCNCFFSLLSTVFWPLPTNGKHELYFIPVLLLATVWTEYMAQIFNPECLGFSGRDYGFWAYILNSFLVSVFVCSWVCFGLWDRTF